MSSLPAPTTLDQRRSVPSRLLGEPGPENEELLSMLQSASRVPDHGKLVPFRFLRIAGAARDALGEALAARAIERDPQAAPAVLEKDRCRFSPAPVIVTVIARITAGHKVPEQEQLLTAGSVCFALLQAAQARGYGAQWLTSWAAYDPAVTAILGLGPGEKVAGFIHIGTPRLWAPERDRPDAASLLSNWVPPPPEPSARG